MRLGQNIKDVAIQLGYELFKADWIKREEIKIPKRWAAVKAKIC